MRQLSLLFETSDRAAMPVSRDSLCTGFLYTDEVGGVAAHDGAYAVIMNPTLKKLFRWPSDRF